MHGFVTSGSFPAPDAVTAINFNLSAAAWRGGVTGGTQAVSRFTTATLTGANFVWVPSAGASVTFTVGSLAANSNGFFTYNLTGYTPSSGCSSSSPGNGFYTSPGSSSTPSAYGIADSASNYVRAAARSLSLRLANLASTHCRSLAASHPARRLATSGIHGRERQ